MPENPKPGFYDVELEVSGRKELALSEDAVRFKIKVTGRATIQNVKITLGSKDKSEKAETFEGSEFLNGEMRNIWVLIKYISIAFYHNNFSKTLFRFHGFDSGALLVTRSWEFLC